MKESFFIFLIAQCYLFHRRGFLRQKRSFQGWVVFFLFIFLSPMMNMGMHCPDPSPITVGRRSSTLSPFRDAPVAESCLTQGQALPGVAHYPMTGESRPGHFDSTWGNVERPSELQGSSWDWPRPVLACTWLLFSLPSTASFSILLQMFFSKDPLTAFELCLRVCFPKCQLAIFSVPAKFGDTE